jgi:homeodomain-containing protein
VLVKPATVARWHREGFRGCWSRRSRRRPGRPRIDSQLRALIRCMTTENRLWGATRIHGELLKLGITVSERTVSRYLPDRLTAPSQNWRTFLANHLGALAFTSTVTSSYAPSADGVVDALLFRLAPLRRPPSRQRTSFGWRVAQAQLHHRTPTLPSSGREPPKSWTVITAPKRTAGGSARPRAPSEPRLMNSLRSFARRMLDRHRQFAVSLLHQVVNVVGGPKRLRSSREAHLFE